LASVKSVGKTGVGGGPPAGRGGGLDPAGVACDGLDGVP